MKKILLDTNAYSNLLRGDANILDQLGEADLVYVSIFVLGELYAGFKGGNKEVVNKRQLEQFLSKPGVQILAGSKETSQIFAEIKNNLKQAGTPIPINDVWIAAHAQETGSLLITYDNHFSLIQGLRIWEKPENM